MGRVPRGSVGTGLNAHRRPAQHPKARKRLKVRRGWRQQDAGGSQARTSGISGVRRRAVRAVTAQRASPWRARSSLHSCSANPGHTPVQGPGQAWDAGVRRGGQDGRAGDPRKSSKLLRLPLCYAVQVPERPALSAGCQQVCIRRLALCGGRHLPTGGATAREGPLAGAADSAPSGDCFSSAGCVRYLPRRTFPVAPRPITATFRCLRPANLMPSRARSAPRGRGQTLAGPNAKWRTLQHCLPLQPAAVTGATPLVWVTRRCPQATRARSALSVQGVCGCTRPSHKMHAPTLAFCCCCCCLCAAP